MTMNKDVYKFILTILKCFLILLFFGIMLPKILDITLYNFITKINTYDNSILVFNGEHRNMIIIYNYILVFNNFFNIF